MKKFQQPLSFEIKLEETWNIRYSTSFE